jgi:tRNA threonylcarbamoyladenosine biosynthesis protein TsaE
MGAGKTTLISAIVRALGHSEETSSPTFSIVNEYKLENGYVYHFDFYRIKNHYEALDIGIDDYFCSGYWNFIEWPEKITNLLPEEVMVVNLEIISTTERSIECFESEVL